MAHFGEATKRLAFWINSDPNLTHHFYSHICTPETGCKTVEEYCAKYAYIKSIIGTVINMVMFHETTRIRKEINKL